MRTQTGFQPLQAGDFAKGAKTNEERNRRIREGVAGLTFPVICSPKLDGIRVLITKEGPVTRKLKPVQNKWLREYLNQKVFHGLDGEVTFGTVEQRSMPDVFNLSTSLVMKREQEVVPFTFSVFDDFTFPDRPYRTRLQRVRDRLAEYAGQWRLTTESSIRALGATTEQTPEDVFAYEELCLSLGYEGIMLRSPVGPYKFGRSTEREEILIKVKRMVDAEATIVGCLPLMRNKNEQERDERGYAKRSTSKVGKVADELLGKLQCVTPEGIEFDLGTGFTEAQRISLWAMREQLVGRIVTYKFQGVGVVEKPRFPSFKGLRED